MDACCDLEWQNKSTNGVNHIVENYRGVVVHEQIREIHILSFTHEQLEHPDPCIHRLWRHVVVGDAQRHLT